MAGDIRCKSWLFKDEFTEEERDERLAGFDICAYYPSETNFQMRTQGPSALPLDAVTNPAMFWIMAYKMTDSLMVLAESGAIDALIEQPRSAQALAKSLALHTESLSMLLKLLVSAGILEAIEDRYAVPATTQMMLPMIFLETRLRHWHATNRSLLQTLQKGTGSNPLDDINDEKFLTNYQDAMASSARSIALHLFRYGRIGEATHVLDLGGADGALVERLAGMMPHASFTVVDRPAVEHYFDRRMAVASPRISARFVADDITCPAALLQVAARADGIVISNLLHFLTKPQISTLLVSLQSVLPSDSRLFIYDQFLTANRLDTARLMVVDWINLGAGFDLCESDMVELLDSLGFTAVTAQRFGSLPGALVIARTA